MSTARSVSTPSASADTSTRTRLHSWQHGVTCMKRRGSSPRPATFAVPAGAPGAARSTNALWSAM
eukprot:4999250-Prymnesium_polylepis.1